MVKEYFEIEIDERTIFKLLCLVICGYVFFREVFVVLNFPIVFGDEGFHSMLAKKIAESLEYFKYYDFIGDNLKQVGYYRPPLWNFFGASFFLFFGEFGYRVLLPLLAFIYGIGIYSLLTKIFDESSALFSTILAITIPSFVTYSLLFYVDCLFTLAMTFSFLFYVYFEKTKRVKYLIVSSIFGSLAVLTKVIGLSIFVFYGLIFLKKIFDERFRLTRFLKNNSHLIIAIFLLFLFGFSIWIRNYFVYGDFCYFKIPLLSKSENVCVISKHQNKFEFKGRTEEVGSEVDVLKFGLTNYLNFAYGNWYFFMLFVFSGIVLSIFEKRFSFLFFLLSFLIFLIIKPGVIYRTEDTARYTLGWSGFLCILAGYSFWSIVKDFKNVVKRGYETLRIILIMLLFVLTISTQFLGIFLPNDYAFGKRIVMIASVKTFSNEFFKACGWVKNNLPKNVTLMSLWTYRVTYNCERKATSGNPDIRLSKDLNLTLNLLKNAKITHIFLEKFSIDPKNRQLSEKYDLEWVEFLVKNDKHFKVIYDSGMCYNTATKEMINANISQTIKLLKEGYFCDGVTIFEVKL